MDPLTFLSNVPDLMKTTSDKILAWNRVHQREILGATAGNGGFGSRLESQCPSL